MDGQEIILSINQIYNDLKIPDNLREHMFRVASVAVIICDNWKGHEINKEDIIAACLIHDLGNIVKFDFSNPRILGNEIKRIDFWKKVQQEVISKYGSNEHQVTKKMAEEIGISKRLMFLLTNQHFLDNKPVAESNDFELKICTYADYRVGPFGILSLDNRLKEFKERYSKKGCDLSRLDFVHKNGLIIEQQIFEHTTIKPEDINDEVVNLHLERFRQ